MLKTISGDLTTIKRGRIFHQVNCQSAFGSGLAYNIAKKWPIVKTEYHKFCEGKQDIDLLGRYQSVLVTDPDLDTSESLSVINIFGQLFYGSKERDTDYGALKMAFKDFSHNLSYSVTGLTNYFPLLFGAWLGKGDEKVIHRLIEAYFPDAILVEYAPEDL